MYCHIFKESQCIIILARQNHSEHIWAEQKKNLQLITYNRARIQNVHTHILFLVLLDIFMAALWNRAYFCPLVSICSFFLFSSPNLSGRRLDVYHTRPYWPGLSANLECSSEMFCKRLAGNTGRKKSLSAHHCTTLSGMALQQRVSQTFQRWAEGASYIWQGGHHIGHRPHSSSVYFWLY